MAYRRAIRRSLGAVLLFRRRGKSTRGRGGHGMGGHKKSCSQRSAAGGAEERGLGLSVIVAGGGESAAW